MALIQEMAVKVDQDFLTAMLALFTPGSNAQADRQKVKQGSGLRAQLSGPQEDLRDVLISVRVCSSLKEADVCLCQSQLLSKDLQLLQSELIEASLSDTSGLSFFEDFHISPLKVRRPEMSGLVGTVVVSRGLCLAAPPQSVAGLQ